MSIRWPLSARNSGTSSWRNGTRHEPTTRLKARFLSFRLNVPSADESEILLTVDDWKLAEARPEGIPAGRPIVGIDLGSGASVVGGCCDVGVRADRGDGAQSPGIPDLDEQEKRDHGA